MLPPSIANLLSECEKKKREDSVCICICMHGEKNMRRKKNTRQKNIRKGKRTEDYLALKDDFKQICLPFPE